MNTTADGFPEPRHDPIAACELQLHRDGLSDEEQAYSALADLCDATTGLEIEPALAVAETFNLVADVVRPARLVTHPTATLRELFADACAVLGRLSAAADTPDLAFRYATANRDLQAVAQWLGLDFDLDFA